ncbi:unnamed protein product (macronuclear) [Paramecium tetraurelia]|uniref:EamA domain-containing protein n=1 Tax=Paramecium tetraurelia TaxID=5888 RepID=A0DGU5_PARTE|nr:uncharacterized protein GSPATT00002391001 [Paramecium tetraurelia]CAK82262.1 unnamed protein product [Paramecium tetraurelia]|eukprot:XP_001449659.1 hypothetical protein (macronuclear) [Paramecium tetraurelia strain d4-2]
MKINENNDKSFHSASIQKASSMLNMIEDLNNQQTQNKQTTEPKIKKAIEPQPIISSQIAREVEELEQTYKRQQFKGIQHIGTKNSYTKYMAFYYWSPLYLTIHKSPIIRTAWRQGFTALIYIPISIYELKNNKNCIISFKGQEFNLLMASVTQAIFAVSLSISVTHTHVSHALMFYNSSLLIYCGTKIILKQYCHILEYFGFGVALILLMVIFTNMGFTFYSKQDVSIWDKIIFGDLTALFGGGVSTLYYAKYYSKIAQCCPTFTLFSIIRALSTVVLIIMTLTFDNQHNFFDFLEPVLFIQIFLNALFTGVMMNQLQSYVQLFVDPLTYNSANFFQPLFGSIFSYLLGQESLPGSLSIACMILYSIGLLFIQIGRSKSETEDLNLDIELRQLDTVYFENNPLLSLFQSTHRDREDQMKISLYKRSIIQRQTILRQPTKQFVDYSMDQ